jgi:hypothetical protein
MTTTTTLTEKKTPMTIQSAMTVSTNDSRSIGMNILKEALSRARMRSPQNEAFRSARRVVIEARRRQARELGDVSQLLIR